MKHKKSLHQKKKRIVITTSIPYVNARPHIGFAQEILEADALARYYRLTGHEVFFLTGTDENAIKNVESAQKANAPVKDFVDKNAQEFKNLTKLLDITHDGFIRTSSDKHKKGAQAFWKLCAKDIYKKSYEGLYCTGCEVFYKDGEFEGNICPLHNRPLEKVTEENYFFKLSKYEKELKRIIKNDTIAILPPHKKEELLHFIDKGLEDFSVSRPIERSKHWGVTVPGDESQTIYVWFDALVNYLTGLGFGTDEKTFDTWWNSSTYKIHIIGKDIIKFHLLYWPAMLLSAGLPLPNKIIVHEFITVEGKKMSKTLGNVVYPQEIVDVYGLDAFRYYFLREVTPFADSNFAYERLDELYSAELANEIGNLALRLATLAEKDKLTLPQAVPSFDDTASRYKLKHLYESFHFPAAALEVLEKIKALNKDVNDNAPWSKTLEERKEFLVEALTKLRDYLLLLEPLVPALAEKAKEQLTGAITKRAPWFARIDKQRAKSTPLPSALKEEATSSKLKEELTREGEGKKKVKAAQLFERLKQAGVAAGVWVRSKARRLRRRLKIKTTGIQPSLKSLYSRYPKKYVQGGIAGVILLFIALVYLTLFKDLPSPRDIGKKNYQLSTQILDRNGKELYQVFKDQNRVPVHIKDLPPHVPQAFVAVEDKDFYKHGGIVLTSGILRALKDYITGSSSRLQGGSTITQQLVKTSLLSSKRSVKRKIQEAILALQVEQMYSKEQILELYLNQVAFGGSAYGIEQASKSYFNKSAKDLTIAEAALLAGLPQAPSRYSPFVNPQAAIKRRNEVLSRMYEQKYLTKEQYEEAKATEPVFATDATPIKAPHFVFYVKEQLEDMFGADLVESGGLVVKTTLDLEIQEKAEAVVYEELEKIKKMNVNNGAVLVTRPSTGEILSMVGSKDYFATGSGRFNVTLAKRQPGSSIKPLVYATAMERNLITPSTMLLDVPTCFQAVPRAYCPQNYDNTFHGLTQVRFALANSYNIPAVKAMALQGVQEFIASSESFLITSLKEDPQRYGLSLSLGGGEIPMVEMAQAYSAFPNQGIPKRLQAILEVKDRKGEKLYEFKDPNFVENVREALDYPKFLAIEGKRAISPETAFLISHILLDNGARSAAFGSGSQLVVKGKKNVSVKTGTTNEKRDNWTIGYTPNFLVTVWVGNNDNSPMSRSLASGITGAAPIWNKVMEFVLSGQKDLEPRRPDSIEGRQICVLSGLLPPNDNEGDPGCQLRYEYFRKGTVPKEREQLKQVVKINKDTNNLAKDGDVNVEDQEKMIARDPFGIYCIDCDPANTPRTFVKNYPPPQYGLKTGDEQDVE